jgi:hypothetical protein
MFNTIQQAVKSDSQLAKLLAEARDFAQVYVLARQRQKGCDGMGELATMKEEFRDVVGKVVQYSMEKKYISEDISYDIDSIAEVVRLRIHYEDRTHLSAPFHRTCLMLPPRLKEEIKSFDLLNYAASSPGSAASKRDRNV